MKNTDRAEKTRHAILEAAQTIIAQEGVSKFTLDGIARESGISKGGVMHHFKTKDAVLAALIDEHRAYFDGFAEREMQQYKGKADEFFLTAEILKLREAITKSQPVAFALLSVLILDANIRERLAAISAQHINDVKKEASQPDQALLRLVAAQGLAYTTLLGLSPLSEQERNLLFERILDPAAWPDTHTNTKKTPEKHPRKRPQAG